MNIQIQAFFDPATYTLTYVVADRDSQDCLIIDSVADYDPASSTLSYESTKKLADWIDEEGLTVVAILETHAHADHVTGAPYLKTRYPKAPLAIGKNISQVQSVFKNVFALEALATNGEQFDLLLSEDETYQFGSLELKTIFTPGHTPACSTYLIGENLFTGDALFMPDYGTGRCDFPSGSAQELWHSIQKIYHYPDHYKVFVGHDYSPGGREVRWQSSVGEQKQSNIQLSKETSQEDFVKFRKERDATLSAPKLLLPSVQLNIDGGHLPKEDSEGRVFLKIPLRKK